MISPFEIDQTGESSAFRFQISTAAEIEKSVPQLRSRSGCSPCARIGVRVGPEWKWAKHDSGAHRKSVHLGPEFMFTMIRNRCSRCARISVHVAPESPFTMAQNTH